MSIGITELFFVIGSALFYFYALYVLILTLYETYRSDRPQPNGEQNV